MRSCAMLRSNGEDGNMPDNARFYHIAYVVAIAIYALYAHSIRRRMSGLDNSPK